MKEVLFTGASGFLGKNVLPILKDNYLVDTLDICKSSLYNINLTEKIPVFNKKYDIVIHAAGKVHIKPKSYKDIQSFYDVNYQGTINLCSGFSKSELPCSIVFISTVAVYGCEYGEGITEEHPLKSETPYGRSKIQAEKYLSEWCEKSGVLLTIIRPSLLAGKNPPGNLGDMINGISKGIYFSIAGGKAKKSIAMAEDIGKLIPYCENKSGIFNLCDNQNPTFRELEELISKQLNRTMPINIPIGYAKTLAKLGDLIGLDIINTDKLSKITNSLTFSNKKIRNTLKFIPADVLSNFLIK